MAPCHRTSPRPRLPDKADARPLTVAGPPSGSQRWRATVAAAATTLHVGDGLRLGFVLPPRYWVDLDTLVQTTAEGLRDAGVLAPRYAGLDAIMATKTFGAAPSAVIAAVPAAELTRGPPGEAAVDACAEAVPRPGSRDSKREWRACVADAWGARPHLHGRTWADVALGVPGSLLGPLEVVLDALEPVLGRDPRGREWQEFFPNDDRIEWLRVRRIAPPPRIRLQMGVF